MYKKVILVLSFGLVLVGCGGEPVNNNGGKETPVEINATQSEANTTVQEAIVARHNHYRDTHGVPHLSWSNVLGAHAQTWANYLAKYYTKDDFDHHTTPHARVFQTDKHTEDDWQEGENIAMSTARNGYYMVNPLDITVEHTDQWLTDNNAAAIDAWASEGYYYENGISGYQVGHYTQLMWTDTMQVGCGKALSEEKIYFNGVENVQVEYVVCRYSPWGNIQGEKPY